MPDLWDSGPALPPLSRSEPSTLDRPVPGAQGRAGGGDVQHIDGAAYRTGALSEGLTPFPFEQAERHLDGKQTGLYGTDAVPGVRAALRDAVAAEGPGAYDRFGADPGAFGAVRGDAAGAAALGRELREVEALRAHSVETGHLVPVEAPDVDTRSLRPSGVYVTGPDAEATVRALDRYSALDLSRDPTTGQVTAAPITAEEEGALGVQDRWLLRAVQGWKTDVTLETTRADTAPDLDGVERQVVVGRYDGSRVDAATERVAARQVFNLRHAQVLERATGASVGGSVAHEIIEAYAGARGFPGQGYDKGFTATHKATSALDSPSDPKWAMGESADRGSNRIIISIRYDADPAVPGLDKSARLYVDPLRHARLDSSGAVLTRPDGSIIADPGPPDTLDLP